MNPVTSGAASPRPLDGRVAVVTGAARGQGRSHALALGRLGASVVVADVASAPTTAAYDLASPDDMRTTTALLDAASIEHLAVTTDVRSTAAVDDLVQSALERFGRIDVLVANAGISAAGAIDELTDEQWHDVLDTNLTGVFRAVRAVVPTMRSAGFGRIVVTSSMSGRGGNAHLAHYSASKFGLVGLVKAAALELARTGITVNAVCPSTTDTPMIHNTAWYRAFRPDLEQPELDDVRDEYAALNPLRVPWLPVEAVSDAVCYLVRDPGYTTGAVLEVGLGLSATKP